MYLQSHFRYASRILMLAVVSAAGLFVLSASHHPATAMASARHPIYIKGKCGIHRGRLVLRNSFHNEYRVRIGVRNGTSGGSHECHGYYHKTRRASASLDFWTPFVFRSFTWHGFVDVGIKSFVTAGACTAFAGALVGEGFSLGADTPITIAAGAGCTEGSNMLVKSINRDFPVRR